MSCVRVLCVVLGLSVVVSGIMELKVTGLPNSATRENKDYLHKTYTYNYNDIIYRDSRWLTLQCSLSGGNSNLDTIYHITFGNNSANVTLGSGTPVTYEVILLKEDSTVLCMADKLKKSTSFVTTIHFNYIQPATTSNKPATIIPSSPTTDSSSSSSPSPSPTAADGTVAEFIKEWWKEIVTVCLALITLIIAIRCAMMMCRQKKPLPAEPNYANLSRDNNYSTMPVPAPRTMQKPSVGQKPLKIVGLENTYSEPQDSQDMSDALYADPRRFAPESDTYAEPYVKTDTYAVPYKQEPAYAELDSTKELYAKPIPKAQRKPKMTDDSNYSNVFGSDYSNANK